MPKQKELLIWVVYEKITHVVKFCAQKECRCAVSGKVFFNLVKDLCKLNEGWSRSVSILVASESPGIYDLGGLRKSSHVVVKFCAQKSFGMQFHEKCFSI